MSSATQLSRRSLRATLLRNAVSIGVSTFLVGAGTGFADWAQTAESEPKTSVATTISSPLDGRTFHGEIVDQKGVVRAKDMLTFKDGKFHSVTCAQLGFGASPYWIRMDGKAIHFLVETSNPESGTMRFSGTVRGEQVEAHGLWTKERWYWSIRREILFRAIEKR